jgi:hypothetical protein
LSTLWREKASIPLNPPATIAAPPAASSPYWSTRLGGGGSGEPVASATA